MNREEFHEDWNIIVDAGTRGIVDPQLVLPAICRVMVYSEQNKIDVDQEVPKGSTYDYWKERAETYEAELKNVQSELSQDLYLDTDTPANVVRKMRQKIESLKYHGPCSTDTPQILDEKIIRGIWSLLDLLGYVVEGDKVDLLNSLREACMSEQVKRGGL